MISRIKTWWRAWQARRDARLIEDMRRTIVETRRLLNIRPEEYASGGFVGVDPARVGADSTIRIWNGARPAQQGHVSRRRIGAVPSQYLEGNVSVTADRDGDTININSVRFDPHFGGSGILREVVARIPTPMDVLPSDTFLVARATGYVFQRRETPAGGQIPDWPEPGARQTATQVMAQRSLEAAINRISQSFQHVGEQSEAMARAIAQMQLARRPPREVGTLRDLSERVEISPKTGKPLPPMHPDTGKVLKSRKVQRSVLGVEVEATRGATRSVLRETPEIGENDRIAIKFKRRQK